MSSECIFASDKVSLSAETHLFGAEGAYGRPKPEGERRVAAVSPTDLIVRTALAHSPYGTIFYGPSCGWLKHAPNLASLPTSTAHPPMRATSPKYCWTSPRASLRAGLRHRGLAHCLQRLLHLGRLTNIVFARSAAAHGDLTKVYHIATAEYPTPARWPAKSRLDCERLRSDYSLALPNWRSGVDRCPAGLLAQRRTK